MSNKNSAVANSGATKPEINGKDIKANLNCAKPELSNLTVSAPAPGESHKPATIQERINRFYELEKLMERRDLVVEHLEKLGGFTVTPTGGAHMKITDDKGIAFGIAHPHVIGEMVHIAKEKLRAELETIEAQIII
ncbi:MAG: hypothetical protein ABI921_13260 [Panacibacter sp.]